jgi:predicted RNA polymerase sigma factor
VAATLKDSFVEDPVDTSINGFVLTNNSTAAAAGSQLPKLMNREREIALALSSCPASVASKAAVYVLEKSGYVKVRESQNGFTAIVQHALPTSQDPQCMDAEGTRTFLPRYLRVAELRGRAGAEKRIVRAKHTLSEAGKLFDVESQSEFAARLPTVLRALYLLFNEGYHGASKKSVIRTELCQEAMRLAAMLLDHPAGATPETYALSALMCLNAARLPGRVDALGELQTFENQDRSSWDPGLVAEGLALLGRSASGASVSRYHIEAAIAAFHTTASVPSETDWRKVVQLYDALIAVAPSPVVALNRAIAIGQVEGPERGLAEMAVIPNSERLTAYPFYQAAMGELEFRRGRHVEARQHFRGAVALARNATERGFLERRERACDESGQRNDRPL